MDPIRFDGSISFGDFLADRSDTGAAYPDMDFSASILEICSHFLGNACYWANHSKEFLAIYEKACSYCATEEEHNRFLNLFAAAFPGTPTATHVRKEQNSPLCFIGKESEEEGEDDKETERRALLEAYIKKELEAITNANRKKRAERQAEKAEGKAIRKAERQAKKTAKAAIRNAERQAEKEAIGKERTELEAIRETIRVEKAELEAIRETIEKVEKESKPHGVRRPMPHVNYSIEVTDLNMDAKPSVVSPRKSTNLSPFKGLGLRQIPSKWTRSSKPSAVVAGESNMAISKASGGFHGREQVVSTCLTNTDCNTYGTEFNGREQASPCSPEPRPLSAIDIDVSIDDSIEISEIESGIALLNTKAGPPVDTSDTTPKATTVTSGPTKCGTSASENKNWDHTTLFPPHRFSFGQVLFPLLTNMKLPIETSCTGRPKVKIKQSDTPWSGYQRVATRISTHGSLPS